MVVGTRSAVFAPVDDLALVIVDEEQDPSYKQEETPRYHARDVAVMRAKMANAAVVLGSATPSLESYFNAKKGKYKLLELPDRVEQRPAARSRDHRHASGISGNRKRASYLAQAGRRNQRAAGAQRAGDGPAEPARIFAGCAVPRLRQDARVQELRHRDDPSQARPPHGVPLLRLYRSRAQSCSIAAASMCISSAPARRSWRSCCTECFRRRASDAWIAIPCAAATTSSAPHALDAGELDLLVGTQMIAKGHDIHGVTLVGVVGADMALGFPDFRAAERTFQLLTQVEGRAGRGQTPGKVVLQTYFPGSLRRAICGETRLCRLLRERAALPQLDALSAVQRFGQRAGAQRQTG